MGDTAHVRHHPVSTTIISRFYKRRGLIRRPQRKLGWHAPLKEPLTIVRPGEGVQLDVKYVYPKGRREYQFTVLDPFTEKCYAEIFPTRESKNAALAIERAARYVYYGCNRSKVLHCGNTYIREEEELIKKLVALIGEMEINGGAIKKKFDEEYARMQKFQKAFLGVGRVSAPTEDPDPRQYATHVLTEGTVEERRELLGCLKSKLILKNREVVLGKE